MIFCIVGPTGIGKSYLSEKYREKYNCYIVNGDCFQCYKEMKIGTAKIEDSLIEDGNHFLFSIQTVNKEYTIYDYQKDLRAIIDNLLSLNKKNNVDRDIVIVGGSGLYLKSALYDFVFNEQTSLINMEKYEKLDNVSLHEELKKIDPIEASKIHYNNRKRVMRAIQIYLENGENKSSLIQKQEHKLLYDVTFIGLETTSRDSLYDLINKRVDSMVEEGLIEEARELYSHYDHSLRAFQAIGYKELFSYFDNQMDLETSINLIKQHSRNYAKRQYTYFRHQLPVKWFNSLSLAFNYMEEKHRGTKKDL